MRLHRLTLQAIGPYAGEHTIDFVELGRAGLFLLEGPTGAGKSTIIDAIVFGLYGELAGTGASKDRLHSHHAQPGTEPFVELVFETGSGVYRVRRTPAYQRPKQRGAGFTPQQASATLVRLTVAGRLHPELGRVADWADTATALTDLRDRRIRGKAVLTISGKDLS
jgi:exonuclease SbcC